MDYGDRVRYSELIVGAVLFERARSFFPARYLSECDRAERFWRRSVYSKSLLPGGTECACSSEARYECRDQSPDGLSFGGDNALGGAQPEGRVGFLPPGEYFACVRATGGLWLDPCEWDSKRPTVSIQDEQSTADLKVTLKKGTVVEVRVDDPGRLLAQHEGKTKGAGMMVAIASDGLVLRFIPIAATETAGRTHRLIVPYETPLRLIIQGGSFAVSDSFGIPLKDAEATVLPFTVARGKDLPPFGIRIGGIK